MKKSITSPWLNLMLALLVIPFTGCEKTYLSRYFIENKSDKVINISLKRNSEFIKNFDIEPNGRNQAFYMGDFYSDNDIPRNGDTVYVRLNDSVFIDTEGLTRSITHYSTYKEYDKVIKGNNTTWYYSFTVDQEYLDILRKQIKGN